MPSLKRLLYRAAFLCLLSFFFLSHYVYAQSGQVDFESLVASLADAKLKATGTIAENIAGSKDPRAAHILQNLLDGQLYFVREDKRIIIAVLDPNDKKAFYC